MPLLDPAQLHAAFIVSVLALGRTTGMMLVVRILPRPEFTASLRNCLTIGLSLPVIGHVWTMKPTYVENPDMLLTWGLWLKELFLGFVLGLPFAATNWAVEAAGTFIDEQRGATMASLLHPASGTQGSPLGIFLSQLYFTWLFVSGGFSKLLEILYRSHEVWPLWSFRPAIEPAFARTVLALADELMQLTLLLAAPAIVAMFISEISLALIGRFAPQLQVFYVAMPLKSIVGLVLLAFSLTSVLAHADDQMVSLSVLLTGIIR